MFPRFLRLIIFSALLLFLYTSMPVFAVNEMEHETYFTDDVENIENSINLEIEENTISDKIKENSESKTSKRKKLGTPTGSPIDLFRLSGYTFKEGPIQNQKFRFFFHGGALFDARTHEDFSGTSSIAAAELQSETLFADGKTSLVIAYNLAKNIDKPNSFFQKFSSLYLQHKFNEHQTIEIGETRVPIGYEGGISSSSIKMYSRSQIARNFGNYYSTGIKNVGKYKYGIYNIGIYDASRSFRNNFRGCEYSALVGLTPLAKFDDKFGSLQIGGSIDTGNSDNSFTIFGGHILYEYKKFHADFEYLYANGLSGNHYGRGRAHGLYSTVSYLIHPKLEILARYDFFQNINNENVSQEYSAGLTYYFNPKVKILLQYVYATKDNIAKPAHKIYLGTDFSTAAILDLL